LSDTHPDLGWASGPVEVHWKIEGRGQLPPPLELEELLEEELLELPPSHPPELLEDELLLLDPPSQPKAIQQKLRRIIVAAPIILFFIVDPLYLSG
jgi:hypothetical protein